MSGVQLTPHRAGEAHYPGRIDDMTGQVFGPTTYGDAERDRTTVTFNHAAALAS